MLKEFREFAMKGNLVDMAVGVTLGAAFGVLSGSFVTDIFSPPVGLLTGGTSFANLFLVLRAGATPGPYPSLAVARDAGAVTLNYGSFLDAVINFLIVAFAMFLVVRGINRLRRAEEAAPAPPPGPTPDQKLLTEIRDLLRRA